MLACFLAHEIESCGMEAAIQVGEESHLYNKESGLPITILQGLC